MSLPLVSVIITAYNREKYIGDAIESVLQSTYKNFELIIVDDGSTDNTRKIISNYNNYSNVKTFFNPNNLGQFENRNYSASLASGKYIKYLDSDDLLYKYGLEVMVDIMERYPDAGAAMNHGLLHDSEPYPIYLSTKDAYRAFFIKGGFPTAGPSGSIFLKEAFFSTGGFPKPYYVGTDIIMLLKIASQYPILKIQPGLIWYRQHDEQEMAIGNRNFDYIKNNNRQYLACLLDKNCPLNELEIKQAVSLIKKTTLRKALSCLKHLKVKEAYYNLKAINLS